MAADAIGNYGRVLPPFGSSHIPTGGGQASCLCCLRDHYKCAQFHQCAAPTSAINTAVAERLAAGKPVQCDQWMAFAMECVPAAVDYFSDCFTED